MSLFFLLTVGLPWVSHGQTVRGREKTGPKMPTFQKPEEGEPVEIEAEHLSYDREEQVYQAHGNVEITQGNFSLKADHARMDMITHDTIAWGNVVLQEAEDVLECERLDLNLETRSGKVYQGKLFLKDQNFHITCREAEKLGESSYRIHEGSLTTCDASRPPWKFTVRELDITLKGMGIAREPVFYVEDLPVFYFPVVSVPVKQERQTGFLVPVVGYSNTYGPQARTGFYWAMSKDMDSTLYLDYQGERGFKEGLEYRYAFPHETSGQARFYFIDDHVYGDNRYAFFLQHEQKLPDDFYIKADVNYVSDRFYPQDFTRDLPQSGSARIDAASLNELRSVLFGGKNWDHFSFLVNGEAFNNLTQGNNAQTLQELPQVSLYAHPQSLFKTPLFYDATLSYVNFWRREGLTAQRTDFLPEISYPMRLFDFLKVSPNAGFRETSYLTYHDPMGDRSKSRETFTAGIDTSAELYRVYETSSNSKIYNLLGVTRWMHTFEPTVSYNYIPNVFQNDLPEFNAVDRIPYQNEITYGFTSRLLGKTSAEKVGTGPYEYVRLNVSQGYSLGNPYEQDWRGRGKYFSNIKGELRLNFDPYLSFRGDAQFNPYRGMFDALDGLVRVKDFRGDTLQAEYRFTKDKIQQLNLFTKVKTIDPVYLYGSIRYNLLQNWRVESVYGVLFQLQCWSLGVMVEDINQSPDGTQKKELRVEAYVTLLGLGSLGHRPYLLNLP